ncbi:MAG: phosphogluconate dehydratase [Marinobacter sp.]|nr:phosphogluconate dehydratase [Marinobacter sp.]
MHPVVERVTQRIIERSRGSRQAYLDRMDHQGARFPQRQRLSCGNLAHGFAACGSGDKQALRLMSSANIGIVTAYNDMLSAHQPYARYPDLIKDTAQGLGSVAQVAGATPAMCDGVTQGQPGMDLSLFSRDVIAMSTAIALSHSMFDGALLLGICDKIVPGLLIGALSFGYLPVILVPGGPMPSGLPNREKQAVRQRYAEGKASREELLEAEAASYHSPGTCTFYGTANSNQMLVEVMGLHVPGAAFVNPGTPLREALTQAATEQVIRLTRPAGGQGRLCDMVDERAIVNALVALLATGGSTNHTLHWVAVARAAGIVVDWDDFAELSHVTPLLARIYPNGSEDINAFQEAGGTAYLIRELLAGGLLHPDVNTVLGQGLADFTRIPAMDADGLVWLAGPVKSRNPDVLRPLTAPFAPQGGLQVLTGNLGRAVIKVSAVAPEHRRVTAPARVFDSQAALVAAFESGSLEQDCVAVVRFQGPQANGMPELHKLTPYLGVLQDRGFKVALVTDGRMSGASGKVPAAIHLYPEALAAGPLALIQDGDLLTLNADTGELSVALTAQQLATRTPAMFTGQGEHEGCGRELFAWMRRGVTVPEQGGSVFWPATD